MVLRGGGHPALGLCRFEARPFPAPHGRLVGRSSQQLAQARLAPSLCSSARASKRKPRSLRKHIQALRESAGLAILSVWAGQQPANQTCPLGQKPRNLCGLCTRWARNLVICVVWAPAGPETSQFTWFGHLLGQKPRNLHGLGTRWGRNLVIAQKLPD